ncbi:uncharacterized protein VTP21DRAFT_8295 [Calcarisporiella thermophila]|uniref:uncharacterized protein n=1 Tax=Calcarisporiella thermophila TaxID=911321 RepID=UPI003744725C
MSDQEKQPYYRMADEDRDRFIRERYEYRKHTISEEASIFSQEYSQMRSPFTPSISSITQQQNKVIYFPGDNGAQNKEEPIEINGFVKLDQLPIFRNTQDERRLSDLNPFDSKPKHDKRIEKEQSMLCSDLSNHARERNLGMVTSHEKLEQRHLQAGEKSQMEDSDIDKIERSSLNPASTSQMIMGSEPDLKENQKEYLLTAAFEPPISLVSAVPFTSNPFDHTTWIPKGETETRSCHQLHNERQISTHFLSAESDQSRDQLFSSDPYHECLQCSPYSNVPYQSQSYSSEKELQLNYHYSSPCYRNYPMSVPLCHPYPETLHYNQQILVKLPVNHFECQYYPHDFSTFNFESFNVPNLSKSRSQAMAAPPPTELASLVQYSDMGHYYSVSQDRRASL